MPQVQQTIADTARDTAVVKSPLPGGAAAFTRWLLNLPSWIQITCAVIALGIAAAVGWWLWRRRAAIWTWVTTRSRGAKIALATVVTVVVVSVVAFGVASWNFMMHDNNFCASCHVMTGAYVKFQHSEHSKLQCHDCHQQSIFVSARQLINWVADKPTDIPNHAKVPNVVCSRCHVRGPGQDSVWKHVIATAGHRVHLNSSDPKLRDAQCVKCHGAEVHHFVPVDATCGQAGCHEDKKINFAGMSDQTSLHCVRCHQFTASVSETISLDSASKFLVPNVSQCFSCHNDMQKRMGNFAPEKDPHQAVCGACHNPHTQRGPKDAWTTCTNAGCHANPVALTPLHKGVSAVALAKCQSCHQAHVWAVSADKCLDCHKDIYKDRPVRSRMTQLSTGTPALFASTAAQQPVTTLGGQAAKYTGSEKFLHSQHRSVTCTSCHESGREHGALTVKTTGDCQACHHAAPTMTAKGAVAGKSSRLCVDCHGEGGPRQPLKDSVTFKLTAWKEPRTRVLDFRHDKHASLGCLDCHQTPLTLTVPATKNCESCHTQHHTPTAQCSSCHPPAKTAHTRQAHLGCAGSQCHALQTVQNLEAKRNVCLVCHQTMVDHKPGRECAACHQVQWLTTPVQGTQ